MKLMKWALLFALASVCWGQTTYNLPTTTVDYIPYSTYANLFADDISLTIGSTPYYVNFTAHTDSAGNCISSCYVTFQDLTTGVETPVPYTGSFTSIVIGQPTTLSGTFSGAFTGSFVLNIVPYRVCGRYGCRTNYRQQNSTLTLTTPVADGGPIPLCPPRCIPNGGPGCGKCGSHAKGQC